MPVQGDETDLFERHHEWRRGAVTQYSSAPEHLVDEACSFAWEQLLTHQPDRERVAGWLWKTALRKAWRLEQFESREVEEARSARLCARRLRFATVGSRRSARSTSSGRGSAARSAYRPPVIATTRSP